MDDLVKQAMAKWPNVPDCYGWLGLDARGDWYMRDDQTQAAGSFEQSKGSRLHHDKLIEFIGRNYEADERGCWYFQNGPQRVFVELMHTPWVWRIHNDGSVTSHTGEAAAVVQAYVDEQGRVYLQTSMGLGLVHTQDVHLAAAEIESGHWSLQEVSAAELPSRFGYVQSPQQLQDEKKPA
jgi:hypothetical protein